MALRKSVEETVSALEKLGQKIPSTADLASQPEQLTRAIHRAWKDAGGTVGGKPRHSDRFLADQLKAQAQDVKSLTPKLVGKTRIKADDASTLISHFLSNWPQRAGSEDADGEIKYLPLLAGDDIAEIALIVSTQIGKLSYPPTVSTPVALTPIYLPGEDIGALLPRFYEQCDCLFTVGTERPLVTQHPKTELLGFRNLMNTFWDIDSDGKVRPLVWVLDMGRQVFEERDVEARQRYLGVQALITRFKALRLFEDRRREERWEWLKSRAFFVILDTKFEQKPSVASAKRPSFIPHHLSFSAIAPEWAMNPNFRALYGSELERLDQRSFSVFYSAEGWSNDDEDRIHRRYFGYAQFTPDPTKPGDKVGRGLELPSPGASYEAAFDTAYSGALTRLKLENRAAEIIVPGDAALAQLHSLSFRLLGLEEFMHL